MAGTVTFAVLNQSFRFVNLSKGLCQTQSRNLVLHFFVLGFTLLIGQASTPDNFHLCMILFVATGQTTVKSIIEQPFGGLSRSTNINTRVKRFVTTVDKPPFIRPMTVTARIRNQHNLLTCVACGIAVSCFGLTACQ